MEERRGKEEGCSREGGGTELERGGGKERVRGGMQRGWRRDVAGMEEGRRREGVIKRCGSERESGGMKQEWRRREGGRKGKEEGRKR
jgi:hypothetical protein